MADENIQIRSEEVQDILGYIPHWAVRSGISVMFVIIVTLLIAACFLKYPDTLTATMVVTTETPPVSIIARSSGRLQILSVHNNEQVVAGDILTIIQNTANHKDVYFLRKQLDSVRRSTDEMGLSELVAFGEGRPNVGELQSAYTQFVKCVHSLRLFRSLNSYGKRVQGLKSQVETYALLYTQQNAQIKLMWEKLSYSARAYERAMKLFDRGLSSTQEVEVARKLALDDTSSYETALGTLKNTKIAIEGQKNVILDLELQSEEQKKGLESALEESYQNLLSQIAMWEQQYVLKAPTDGTVTLNKFWSVDQSIQAGEILLTIVPKQPGRMVGRAVLPVQGSGKVKAGQAVNIKFANYPYLEYGMVRGKVESLSLAPSNSNYAVEVLLTDGLTTNYGKSLPFAHEMQATAEIITENITLIERVFQPVRSVLKKLYSESS